MTLNDSMIKTGEVQAGRELQTQQKSQKSYSYSKLQTCSQDAKEVTQAQKTCQCKVTLLQWLNHGAMEFYYC